MDRVYVCYSQDFYTSPPVAIFKNKSDAKRFCKYRRERFEKMIYKRMYVFDEFKTKEDVNEN